MTEQKTIIIIGGGTGGLVAASMLKKKAGSIGRIILIDKNKMHVYAPAFLYLMLGKRSIEKIQRPLSLLKRRGIEVVNEEIIRVDPINKTVKTQSSDYKYDYLILALGAELVPEKIEGLVQGGYNLYSLKEVERLRDNLKKFPGGKVAIVISSLPFKCPAAPYEAAFLLDEYFRGRGVGGRTEIDIYTPEVLPLPAAGPGIGKAVAEMLAEKKIGFNPGVKLISVNPQKKELLFENDKISHYDFLIFIPPHQGQKVIKDSDLGDEAGWISVDKKTLKTKYDKVFAVGDGIAATLASGKPRPKAGVFAHYEAEVVVENITRELKGLPQNKKYDGRAFCFLETGFGKAGFASGNFYAEPTAVVKMKRPSRIWHWYKILFEKYWLWKWF